jgi:hypothetical protein
MENQEVGIIIGCDHKQEVMLPLFFTNLRLCTDLPVVIFDFGMSSEGRKFCLKRGKVIPIEDSLAQGQTHVKQIWFKKPLACQLAPFEINIWLDLDCKLRQPIESILKKYDPSFDLAVLPEPRPNNRYDRYRKEFPAYIDYNSGVIIFKKNSPFISKWIEMSLRYFEKALGDQDTLSIALMDTSFKVSPLDIYCNYLFDFRFAGELHESAIIHYIHVRKEVLYNEIQILMKNKLRLLSYTTADLVTGDCLKYFELKKSLVENSN